MCGRTQKVLEKWRVLFLTLGIFALSKWLSWETMGRDKEMLWGFGAFHKLTDLGPSISIRK